MALVDEPWPVRLDRIGKRHSAALSGWCGGLWPGQGEAPRGSSPLASSGSWTSDRRQGLRVRRASFGAAAIVVAVLVLCRP